MLTSAFKILVNNPFQESFDITFMKKKKKTIKILITFYFIKDFFSQVINQFPKQKTPQHGALKI